MNQGAASPLPVARGEVALVDAHRDLPDLGRQIHVLVGDAAGQRDRPFDEAGDLIQQAGIVDDGDGFLRRDARDALGDDAFALGGVGQHVVLAQLRDPVGGAGDGERAGRVEAVALGQIARDEAVPIIGAVAQIERHDLAVQQADDPAQRADPGEMARAAPAHGFRPGEAAQHGGHRARDQRRRGDGIGLLFQNPVVAFLAAPGPWWRRACGGSLATPAPARWHAVRARSR